MNPPLNSPQNPNTNIQKVPFQQPSNSTSNNPMRASSSNNREPSPYTSKPVPPPSTGPVYHHPPPSIGYNSNPSMNPTIPPTNPNYYPPGNKNLGMNYNNPNIPNKTYGNPIYEPHMSYDPRGYYPPPPPAYDARFPQTQVVLPTVVNPHIGYARPPPASMNYPTNPYPHSMYVPPATMAQMQQAE